MLVLLVLFLSLVGAQPAAAVYTSAEVASLRELRTGMQRLLGQLETSCGRADTAQACLALTQGFFKLTQAVGWLLHVNVNPDDEAGAALLASARSSVVATAWADLDRALLELNRASQFRGQRDYEAALAALARVNRTLAYAEPFPENYPQKFGPHGNYDLAQQRLWSLIQYGATALQAWLNGITRNALPPCPALFAAYARALETGLVDTWFLAAHVVDPTSMYAPYQTAFVERLPDASPVKRALTEFALVGGPSTQQARHTTYRLRFVLDGAGRCLAASNPELALVLQKIGDSWNNVDEWFGWALAIE